MENEEEKEQWYRVFSVTDAKGYEFHYWVKLETGVTIQTSGDHTLLTDGEVVYLSTFHQSLMYIGLKKDEWDHTDPVTKIIIK